MDFGVRQIQFYLLAMLDFDCVLDFDLPYSSVSVYFTAL